MSVTADTPVLPLNSEGSGTYINVFFFFHAGKSSGTTGEHAQLVRTRKAVADTTRLMFRCLGTRGHENDVSIPYMIRSTKMQCVPSERKMLDRMECTTENREKRDNTDAMDLIFHRKIIE